MQLYQSQLLSIAIESAFNWYWLVDGLMEVGYKVHLANTAAMQHYNGIKYTDDKTDARWHPPLKPHLGLTHLKPNRFGYIPKASGFSAFDLVLFHSLAFKNLANSLAITEIFKNQRAKNNLAQNTENPDALGI